MFATLFLASLALPGAAAMLVLLAALSLVSLLDYGWVFPRHVQRAAA